jgi:histidinol-phosphatase (PHP family)
MDDICRALDRIADCGVAMELNTSGVNKTISEMNPMPAMLREMAIRDIPITLGSDAHVPERVADGYETALELLKECGFTDINYFLERRRHSISIDAALGSLVVGQT